MKKLTKLPTQYWVDHRQTILRAHLKASLMEENCDNIIMLVYIYFLNIIMGDGLYECVMWFYMIYRITVCFKSCCLSCECHKKCLLNIIQDTYSRTVGLEQVLILYMQMWSNELYYHICPRLCYE